MDYTKLNFEQCVYYIYSVKKKIKHLKVNNLTKKENEDLEEIYNKQLENLEAQKAKFLVVKGVQIIN